MNLYPLHIQTQLHSDLIQFMYIKLGTEQGIQASIIFEGTLCHLRIFILSVDLPGKNLKLR